MNKKIALISAGVLAALIAVSYGVVGGALQPFSAPADTNTPPASDSSTMPISAVNSSAAFAFDTIANATIPADIAEANNAFAVDFYKQVDTGSENVFFSPTGMHAGFSMLYEGARYNTAEQIQQVFGIEPDKKTRHNVTAHMMSSLNRDDPHAILKLANSLWIANWAKPSDSYLDISRSIYLANVEPVNFDDVSDNGDVSKINEWANNKTHGKISKVLDPNTVNPSTYMMILNAIYFKGIWETPFPKESTSEQIFWKNSEQSIDADFMYNRDTFDYAHLDDVKILKLLYQGDRLSMLIVLPDDIDGMAHLRENLSPEIIQRWNQNLAPKSNIVVSIPKFEMRTGYDLIDVLKNLGISDAFDPTQADLLNILGVPLDEKYVGNNLYVDRAIHSAYVKVNEEGTEAAALTMETIVTTREPKRFIADHPFMFIIQDNESGAILFMGAIYDPTK